ncbi:MAG: hypothetical protein FJ314_08515, partial [SAR202 cluster bacterium]|nr:hypothetical protein [SAR202 cluster bacterium]
MASGLVAAGFAAGFNPVDGRFVTAGAVLGVVRRGVAGSTFLAGRFATAGAVLGVVRRGVAGSTFLAGRF